jgi:hypothetical protein
MTRSIVLIAVVLSSWTTVSLGFHVATPPPAVSLIHGISSRNGWRPRASTSTDEEAIPVASEPATTLRSDNVRVEAQEALRNVGWFSDASSGPDLAEGALTADDPFVQAINAGIQRDVGVSLDELLNPAKVVNLERDLYQLRKELAVATGVSLSSEDSTSLTTEQCDGGGMSEAAEQLRASIQKKEVSLATERRSVFRGWLKTVFLVQAILSFGLSFVMATNPGALFGGFDWYNNPQYNMDVSIQVLGYWWWWLFVIPSLRSRRPTGLEKQALDYAFVASPLTSLVAPAVTHNTGVIWFLNFVVVGASYAAAYLAPSDQDEDDNDSSQPSWLKFVAKSLDFGSGRERGARQ